MVDVVHVAVMGFERVFWRCKQRAVKKNRHEDRQHVLVMDKWRQMPFFDKKVCHCAIKVSAF